ncbi:NAD-dependent 4,6-dehydratase LegB [soil metagenome]
MAVESGLVAVTGAAGFIGSHVVEELLRHGRRVRALVHYNALGREGHLEEAKKKLPADQLARLEVIAGDITDFRCVTSLVRGCEAVFHLAALIGIPYSYAAPESYVAVNVNGTLNILEACRNESVTRLIHTSSSEVYGTAQTTPMSENHPLQAQSPYAATKIAADKLAESYALSFDFPVTILRPFNTYGPRQSQRAVVPTIIAQALSDKCKSIKLGALDPVRDLTYVKDTARAFRMIAELPTEKVIGRLYNLGAGRGITMGNLAQLILSILKIEKPVEGLDERKRPERSEVRTLISDNNLIRKEVGWKPETALEEGIKETAAYIQKNIKDIRPEIYAK